MTGSSLSLFASLEPAPAGPDGRERLGQLVPWDTPGRANIGPWGVPGTRGLMVRRQLAASLTQDAKIVGVYGHNRPAEYDDAGRLVAAAVPAPAVSRIVPGSLENRDDGLWGRVRIARTPLGDQLLAEIDDGIRDGLSVEVTDLEFDAEGHVAGGRLDFLAHVPVGAYDSARVHRAAAPPSNGVPVTLPAPAPALAAAAAPAAPVLQANLTPGLQPAAPAPAAQPAPAVQPAPAPAPAAPAAPAVDLGSLQLLAQLLGQQQAPAAPVPAPAPAPAAPDGMAQLLAGLQALQAGQHVAAPSAAALMGTAGVPAAPGQAPALQAEADPIREAANLAAQLHNGGGRDATLLAALQDITASGLPLFQEGSNRLGDKLWEGTKDTSRPFVDLMASGPLTAMKYYGWQWTNLPEMEEWAGNKTPINGNPVDLEQVPFTAKRCAAGWDVDRKFKDFGDPEFWAEFFTEQTNAYRRLSNTWAAQALVAAALDVSVAANFIGAGEATSVLPAEAEGLVPTTGVPEGATQIIKAVMIGNVILENTPRVEQTADYVLVNAYDWLRLSDVAAIDLPAFLALLKVDPSRFRTTTKVPRGKVVIGAKPAMKYRELPGSGGAGTPIRVEALDIARGGVDSAVFGYVGISLERVGGVLSIPLDDPDGTVG